MGNKNKVYHGLEVVDTLGLKGITLGKIYKIFKKKENGVIIYNDFGVKELYPNKCFF